VRKSEVLVHNYHHPGFESLKTPAVLAVSHPHDQSPGPHDAAGQAPLGFLDSQTPDDSSDEQELPTSSLLTLNSIG
jgi:hypothetical protein